MGGHEVQPGSSPVYVLHIYENMSYDARAVGGVRCSFDVRESCIFAVCSRFKMAFVRHMRSHSSCFMTRRSEVDLSLSVPEVLRTGSVGRANPDGRVGVRPVRSRSVGRAHPAQNFRQGVGRSGRPKSEWTKASRPARSGAVTLNEQSTSEGTAIESKNLHMLGVCSKLGWPGAFRGRWRWDIHFFLWRCVGAQGLFYKGFLWRHSSAGQREFELERSPHVTAVTKLERQSPHVTAVTRSLNSPKLEQLSCRSCHHGD